MMMLCIRPVSLMLPEQNARVSAVDWRMPQQHLDEHQSSSKAMSFFFLSEKYANSIFQTNLMLLAIFSSARSWALIVSFVSTSACCFLSKMTFFTQSFPSHSLRYLSRRFSTRDTSFIDALISVVEAFRRSRKDKDSFYNFFFKTKKKKNNK